MVTYFLMMIDIPGNPTKFNVDMPVIIVFTMINVMNWGYGLYIAFRMMYVNKLRIAYKKK